MGEKIRCSHILVEKLSLAEEILKKLQAGGNF